MRRIRSLLTLFAVVSLALPAWSGDVAIAPGSYQGYLTQVSDSCGASPSLSTYEISVEDGTYTVRSLNTEVLSRTTDPELVYTGKAEGDAVVVSLSGMRRFPACEEPGAVTAKLTLTPTEEGFSGRSHLTADICGRPCESVNDIEATRNED
jgi:hypothetical protein